MQPAMTHDGVALPFAAPHAVFGVNGAALACLEWLAQCSARIVELDPSLSLDAADRIAGYLWSNERLRNMAPTGAVDLVFTHPRMRSAIPT
jgi:hypothetical protein